MNDNRRVAILMGQDLSFCRNAIRGIRAYALQKPEWTFHNGPADQQSIPFLRGWKPHGIIANLAQSEIARAVLRLRKPVVDTAYALPDLGVPVVDVDHLEVGRMAAKYLLDRRFTHFGFFGSERAAYSRIRETGFREELAQHDRSATSCYFEYVDDGPAKSSWKRIDHTVAQWLRQLPKPVAILACNDGPARNLADMCRQLGLHIPNEVALLGVDDNELECPLTFPPLSSVVIPSERIGYEAARLLDQLMSGAPAPEGPVFLPPVRVVTRYSTDTMAIDDPAVLAAVAYIRNHATENISVANVAQAINGGRRELERHFRRELDHSILDEIRLARIERAKELLLSTNRPMFEIALQSGFSNSERLSVVFRQLTGTTPSDYRRQSKIHERS